MWTRSGRVWSLLLSVVFGAALTVGWVCSGPAWADEPSPSASPSVSVSVSSPEASATGSASALPTASDSGSPDVASPSASPSVTGSPLGVEDRQWLMEAVNAMTLAAGLMVLLMGAAVVLLVRR